MADNVVVERAMIDVAVGADVVGDNSDSRNIFFYHNTGIIVDYLIGIAGDDGGVGTHRNAFSPLHLLNSLLLLGLPPPLLILLLALLAKKKNEWIRCDMNHVVTAW